jgi:hypothetical protein
MKQFDYRKFLKENKSTFHSSLNENVSATARKFAQHMSKKEGKKFTVTPGSVDEKSFDLDLDGEKYMGGSYLVKDNGDIINVAMGNKVAGNINQLEEGEAAYEYEKGKKAGEKMKVSELKAKIKEMILAEAEGDEEEAADDVTDDTEIDVTTDVEVDEVDPNVKAVQDALTQAQAAAQKLGDPKLTDQIGNTITFFTRAHVVEKPKGAVSEGEKIKEGYFGANNEVEELIDTLGYETLDEFFSDNPGVITAILDWASNVPEFRTKMIANGLLEAKKENMNESLSPLLKKILK